MSRTIPHPQYHPSAGVNRGEVNWKGLYVTITVMTVTSKKTKGT
jgi:hypothetical protein